MAAQTLQSFMCVKIRYTADTPIKICTIVSRPVALKIVLTRSNLKSPTKPQFRAPITTSAKAIMCTVFIYFSPPLTLRSFKRRRASLSINQRSNKKTTLQLAILATNPVLHRSFACQNQECSHFPHRLLQYGCKEHPLSRMYPQMLVFDRAFHPEEHLQTPHSSLLDSFSASCSMDKWLLSKLLLLPFFFTTSSHHNLVETFHTEIRFLAISNATFLGFLFVLRLSCNTVLVAFLIFFSTASNILLGLYPLYSA